MALLKSAKLLTLIQCQHCTSYSTGKQFKIMQKLMGNVKSKKSNWYVERDKKADFLPSPRELHKGSKSLRRVTVLNKLFMKHITDLMATGKHSEKLHGHGIQVSQVKMSPSFNIVNVFWIAKGTEDDNVVEDLLKSTAGYLRHELTSLRIIGCVPEIQFVKDKSNAKWVEIDRLLQTADFGPDYEPEEFGKVLKSEFSMDFSLPSNIAADIRELENSEEVDEEPLPEPRQNVFCLKHSEMMARIKASVVKSKAPHRYDTSLEPPEPVVMETIRDRIAHDNHIDFNKEQFTEFLHKRSIEKKKLLKTEEDYLMNKELYTVDYKEEDTDVMFYDTEDFIDDDHEENSKHP